MGFTEGFEDTLNRIHLGDEGDDPRRFRHSGGRRARALSPDGARSMSTLEHAARLVTYRHWASAIGPRASRNTCGLRDLG